MGSLGTTEVVLTLLLTTAAVVAGAWVCAESVARLRDHRFDYPKALLAADEQRESHTLRWGFLARRRTQLEEAEAEVLAATSQRAGTAAGAEEAVARLDRELARLDVATDRARRELRAGYQSRRERARRERAMAWWLDAGFATVGLLVAAAALSSAVAVLL